MLKSYKNNKDMIWYIAGSLTTISFIPQIILLFNNFKKGRGNELSLYFITLLFISIILWFIYAIMIEDKHSKVKKSMIIWNFFSIIFVLIIFSISYFNK